MKPFRVLGALGAAVLLGACSDRQPLAPTPPPATARPLAAYECRAEVRSRTVSCAEAGAPDGVRAVIVGGQDQHVRLTSSAVSYDSATRIFSADVTVRNLLTQAMGTPDGVNVDPEGIRVFFHSGPVATIGTGEASVENPDGVGVFTATEQPFFRYPGLLAPGAATAPKTWRFRVDPSVVTFAFVVYLDAQLQPGVVINEIMARPTAAGEPQGEWFEVYNHGLGPVDLQGWTIASGQGDAGHTITGSVVIPSGGYVVLGTSADTAANGGAPVGYAYSGVTLGNAASDWLALRTPAGWTADSVDWGAAAGDTPAPPPAGVARALSRPDSANLYLSGAGSKWTNAVAVYGAAGERGTPGAYNLRGVRGLSISSGTSHSCVTDDAGRAWCWGVGPDPLGNGGGTPSSPLMVQVSPVRMFGKVSLAGPQSCALDSLGRPYCWGSSLSTSSSVPAPLPNPPSVVLTSLWSGWVLNGNQVVCGLDSRGSAYCWGRILGVSYNGGAPPTVGPVSQLAVGIDHACQLSAGRVYCWGANAAGQLGDSTVSPPHETPVPARLPAGVTFKAVAARGNSTCALSDAGELYCWGNNSNGQLGNGATGVPANPVPMRVPLPAGVTFASISMGYYVGIQHACGLTAGGQAYCWGENLQGQVGDGTRTPRLVPTPVLQPPGVLFSAVEAGGEQVCALEQGSGQPFCWGEGGRVGDGTTVRRLTPVAAGR